MGKQYNTELQAKVETYMKETGISQAKLAPMMNLSGRLKTPRRPSLSMRYGDMWQPLFQRAFTR